MYLAIIGVLVWKKKHLKEKMTEGLTYFQINKPEATWFND